MTEQTYTDIEMWGFISCPHCRRLKDYLVGLGISFVIHNEEDAAQRQKLYRHWAEHDTAAGQREPTSMPQLFVAGVRLGGADEVVAMPREWLLALAGLYVPERAAPEPQAVEQASAAA